MSEVLIAPGASYESVAREIGEASLRGGWLRWWAAFAIAMALVGLLFVALGVLLYEGTGVWGNNIPVTWAMDIIGYDWWIGIATGGLLVSTLLLLTNAGARSALNRIAETVALLAAVAAGLYPIIHLGRPWFFYWTLPYPNTMLLWPQFRSPLVWDAMDIISYIVICISFWYVGLLPDLAALRDRAWVAAQRGGPLLPAQLYGIAALGWRGSALHWLRWGQAYRAIGLMGVLMVFSLQAGAAVMFSGTVEPGWHDTLLPLFFVLGAAFGGVAMLAVVAALIRGAFDLQALITTRHLELLAWLLLGLGLANTYCYAWEFFSAALQSDRFEHLAMLRRLAGPAAWAFWGIVACALLPVQIFWVGPLRRSPLALIAVGLLVSIGLWADRFMVIVVTLLRDFLPSSAGRYTASFWDYAIFIGTIGLFLALLLLSVRVLPMLSILETRRLAPPPRAAVPQVRHG
jgi:Ni/Fe-hydrogenase subunit HybB-like protein